MGAAIASSLSLGLSYCVCTATNSLCNACLGAHTGTGRKRSVLLLTIALACSLWFQYDVGPAIVHKGGGWVGTLVSQVAYSQWYGACEQYAPDDALITACARNAGVFRPLFLAAFLFTLFAIATKAQPSFNREAWPAKLMLFCFLVLVSVVLPTAPLFSGFNLWLARLGATVFVLFQQVILIDVAYHWNEDWVERADQADRTSYGTGRYWLQAIIGTTVALYAAVLTGIVLLYRVFPCPSNVWIITLTLLAVVGVTVVAAIADHGSLLTSSIVSMYVTYLGYSMVSKNPVNECNPLLGNDDVMGMVLGMTLTAISLAWTGWSWTAEERLDGGGGGSSGRVDGGNGSVDLEVPFLDPSDAPTSGVVMDSNMPTSGGSDGGSDESLAHVWKLNVVMALISCWIAMTLTAWGSLEGAGADGSTLVANPTAGRWNMAMLGFSQWCAVLLYAWTLIAPQLFPDRDFA